MGSDARTMKDGTSLVEIYYYDPNHEPDYLDGIHQILMIDEDHIVLTHGAKVETLPCNVIKKIIVRFKNDSSQGV